MPSIARHSSTPEHSSCLCKDQHADASEQSEVLKLSTVSTAQGQESPADAVALVTLLFPTYLHHSTSTCSIKVTNRQTWYLVSDMRVLLSRYAWNVFHNNFRMSRKDSQKNSRAQANLVSEAKAWHQRHAMAMRWWDGLRWALMRHLPCNVSLVLAFLALQSSFLWNGRVGVGPQKLNWQRFTGVLLKDQLRGNILECHTSLMPKKMCLKLNSYGPFGRVSCTTRLSLAPPMIRFMYDGSTTCSCWCLSCFIWGRNSRVPDSSLGFKEQ